MGCVLDGTLMRIRRPENPETPHFFDPCSAFNDVLPIFHYFSAPLCPCFRQQLFVGECTLYRILALSRFPDGRAGRSEKGATFAYHHYLQIFFTYQPPKLYGTLADGLLRIHGGNLRENIF